jgi:hypothetical protein
VICYKLRMPIKPKSHAQDQRSLTRKAGKFTAMDVCPCCNKPRALEPAYTVSDGGRVRDDFKFAGSYVCLKCIAANAA